MDRLEEYLKGIEKAGVTGIIVADPLIIETCKRVAPSVEVHLSTAITIQLESSTVLERRRFTSSCISS